MPYSYAMMSLSDTSHEEDEGADVDGADRDGVKREGGVAESICCDLNCTSLRLTVAASMAHMTKNGWKREKEQKNGVRSS